MLHFPLWCKGVSECQQSKLNCTEKGDFLSAQKHFLSGKYICVTEEGEELSWTSADEPITVEQCEGNDIHHAANLKLRNILLLSSQYFISLIKYTCMCVCLSV